MLNDIDGAVPIDVEPKRVPAHSPAGGNTAAHDPRSQFFGVWRLVSAERQYADGRPLTYPYGKTPVGRISYDKAGRMSAQLTDSARPKPSVPTTDRDWARSAGAEDLRKVLTSIASYYGTYDVDEATQTVSHHVEMALNPAWPGTDLKRKYKFSGDRLTLSVVYPDGVIDLVWEREKD